ncbi:MAG TPA: biopolymer transporter ExbD [Bacteroidia bacterium]|jgi:biopolymer transport protein ExbD|nr:biopolymer transporter ExbD [Bacteroidia bacterium]HQK98483.1 biopolymer transporter ExbD [Bacteroidia bacterium]
MAQIQSNEQDSGKGGKHGKVRAKKQSTHIDMTPMVDLAFLLLTFFMLTTTFGKPKTMEINMPVKDPTNQAKNEVNNALTFLLSGDDKVYWYYGELKPETKLTLTDYSPQGLRKLLLDRNKQAVDEIKTLRENALKNKMADTTLKRMEVDIKGKKYALMVLVKTDDKAKYKNVINVLDELNICLIGKYALVDLDMREYDLIKNFQP